MKEISIKNIVPLGNFDETLTSLREKADTIISLCQEKNQYNSSISNLMSFVVIIVESLEEGISTNKCWNIDEAFIDLLYAHLIIIDLNKTAHKYLNPEISFDSNVKQLNDFIKHKNGIYKDIKITE